MSGNINEAGKRGATEQRVPRLVKWALEGTLDLPLHFLGAWDLGLEEGGGATFCNTAALKSVPEPALTLIGGCRCFHGLPSFLPNQKSLWEPELWNLELS